MKYFFLKFLTLLVLPLLILVTFPARAAERMPSSKEPPNIIIVLADDLAFGDIGANGNRLIKTPHIDALAKKGLNFSQFYASANVCSPSRAGMITGRYPIRTGLAYDVLAAHDSKGLPPEEETLGELAQRAGFDTAYIGKWHLGDFQRHPNFSPLRNGFAHFFGVPHSNDMPDFALYYGDDRIEYPVDQSRLTARYTDTAIEFIEDNSRRPFLLFIAYNAPHIPLTPPHDMSNKSSAGTYGDVVEEIDRNIGRILSALKSEKIIDNTVIFVTSDNGPFFEGRTAGLKGGKGSTYEGGYRVPLIISWPNYIRHNCIDSVSMNIDIFPTIADLIGVSPLNKIIDGKSMVGLFKNKNYKIHDYLYLFNNEEIVAIRSQEWKYLTHAYYRNSLGAFEKFGEIPNFSGQYDLLFSASDPRGEDYSVANLHPDVLVNFKAQMSRARKEFDLLRTRVPDETYPQ